MVDDYRYPSVDPHLRVCADCFGDDGLSSSCGTTPRDACSFCDAAAKRRHRPPFHEVIAHMLSRLGRDYNDPESASIAC